MSRLSKNGKEDPGGLTFGPVQDIYSCDVISTIKVQAASLFCSCSTAVLNVRCDFRLHVLSASCSRYRSPARPCFRVNPGNSSGASTGFFELTSRHDSAVHLGLHPLCFLDLNSRHPSRVIGNTVLLGLPPNHCCNDELVQGGTDRLSVLSYPCGMARAFGVSRR